MTRIYAMTEFCDEDEVRETLRPHERDPDAEPPQVDERDVVLALAALSDEPCSADGSTYLNEFFFNDLSAEEQNAILRRDYLNNGPIRAKFDAAYVDSVRDKLRRAA